MAAETRYVRNGDVRIAYQVVGDGALDLVLVPGLVSNLDLIWEQREHARFCEELAAFSRLIVFDKRGTGLSDRDAGVPTLEDRMDDVRAVMDAAGCTRPAMLSISEGGMMSLLFAATHPRRVRALALYGAFAQSPTRAWPEDQVETRFELIERAWGTGMLPPSVAPSKAADQSFRRSWSRFERLSASPAAATALLRIDREVDLGGVLPAVRVPTLLMHREGDRRVEIGYGRAIAERVPGARYVELPGADHLPHTGDSARLVAELKNFLSSARETMPDRSLATVMAATGDPASRGAGLAGIARPEIARFRGRELAGWPGGLLAAFDGPARAIRCALALGQRDRSLRCGLQIGEIALGGETAGDTGDTAASLTARAEPGEVLVTGAVRDLVAGSGLRFERRGTRPCRETAEPLELFAAFGD